MMIKVQPIRDRERLCGLFELAGHRMPPFGFGVELTAGADSGHALFVIGHEERCISIVHAEATDSSLVDAVIRAGLAAGEQMGCVCFDAADFVMPGMAHELDRMGYGKAARSFDEFFGQCPSQGGEAGK